MNSPSLLLLTISLAVCSFSCEHESVKQDLATASESSDKYYQSEIIPPSYMQVYGKWKLQNISGGFSGKGHQNTFDYLEIKSIGIYGIVQADKLVESGKVIIEPVDSSSPERLQVKFKPDDADVSAFLEGENLYLVLEGDSLSLDAPCCDRYNFHFKMAD